MSSVEKDINILLLGETGVGKSTWINGFVTYLTYATFAEAQIGKDVCLIPTSFTVIDSNYTEQSISTGKCENESSESGESSTQQPKTHVFKVGDFNIRLIDTPGIGDTRGLQQDKENFHNIMTHVANYENIHGIFILLKPNSSRLNATFQFCIKELLANLHKDAVMNIVFCFTNCRATSYRPGETLVCLRKLLEDNKVNITLSQHTMYCIDNEPVRFLAAIKHGVQFTKQECRVFEESWDYAVNETVKLLIYVRKLPPHIVRSMTSVNFARQTICFIIKPLSRITVIIQTNIETFLEKKEELLKPTKTVEELLRKLYIPQLALKHVPLQTPREACESESCVVRKREGNLTKYEYKYSCKSVGKTLFGRFMRYRGKDPACEECGCRWSAHTLRTHSLVEVHTTLTDRKVHERLIEERGIMYVIKQEIDKLSVLGTELENEKQQVLTASAKFRCFLKKNALVEYNDSTKEYLQHQVNSAKSRDTADGVQRMLSAYEEEIRILEESHGDDFLKPEDIIGVIENLYKLKIFGPMLASVMKGTQNADREEFIKHEVTYDICSALDSCSSNCIINMLMNS